MLRQLKSWRKKEAKGKERETLLNAINLGFGASLRGCELRHLRAGDLQPDEGDDGNLTLRICKGNRQGKPQITQKPVDGKFQKIWAKVQRGVPHGDHLFPQNVMTKLSTAIKDAAVRFKWPVDVRWSAHTLRIGGTQRLKQRVKTALEGYFSQQSPSVFKHYAKSPRERSRKRSRE